ncbi:hypothetical protein SAMN04487819_106253 [Actinopolyspora alba]|uniref:Alpha/beta hydrolase family protein n=1 Tax=Actinopolyspora alba TaxID=673379 RepID=A0A1I1X2C6_9ACTN|nr:hypothetical protein SAMN04487819_106253 [Actinopolyspora alba]
MLRRLTMPVLAVVGQRDRVFSSAQTRRRRARAVPHATVIALPEAGHPLPRQAEAVGEFLRAPRETPT